jgi:hypothetical protein
MFISEAPSSRTHSLMPGWWDSGSGNWGDRKSTDIGSGQDHHRIARCGPTEFSPKMALTFSCADCEPRLLVFSALASPPFRSINVGSRSPTCAACGEDGQKIGEIQDINCELPNQERQGLVDHDSGLQIHAKVTSFSFPS